MTAEELAYWKRMRGQEPPKPAGPDPRRIMFAAVPKRVNRFDDEDNGCAGCLFRDASIDVCRAATAEAKVRGLPDCEDGGEKDGDGYVYVAVKVDPRQRDLVEEFG